jgi:hypothetical protein
MDTTDREAEIREIERELQILQRRYANLDAAGRQLRAGFYIMIGLLITFMIVAAIMSHLPALLLWMGVLVFALLNIWALSGPETDILGGMVARTPPVGREAQRGGSGRGYGG